MVGGRIQECCHVSAKCVQGELDHESAVTCVAATYDANLVASGKYGGGVCMWDVATQQPLLHLSGVLFLYMCFLEACRECFSNV